MDQQLSRVAHSCQKLKRTAKSLQKVYKIPIGCPNLPTDNGILIAPELWIRVILISTSAGNLFKIIFRVSAERVQALPINLRYIYKRVFH